MSIWIAGVPIFGTAQKCVVIPPVAVPTKQTTSARLTTRFAVSREYVPTTPTQSGCVPGIASRPFPDVATGMCSASASATSSAPAREVRTPPPATRTGRSAACSTASAARTRSSSGPGRNGGTDANSGSTSASRSSTSESNWPSFPWTWMCTGPGEPVVATRNA